MVTPPTLILLGAGEHAYVVGEAAEAAGWSVLGTVGPEAPAHALPWPHLGGDAALRRHPAAHIILAFADIATRRAAVGRIARGRWATVVHPSAVLSPSARLGPGCFVGPLALVHARARIGAHVVINSGALVEHDVVVGAYAHLAPGCTVGGGARIGTEANICLGAAVRDHVHVGAGARVGMGAVVVGQISPRVTVLGVPARIREA